jgi:hypothetical protein
MEIRRQKLEKAKIEVKEKVRPLKIIDALFLEPHTHCYVM